ncbi:hypothetical protein WMY93_031116 [Mugilogobius chulae]|uniref:Uncharacterized protein n=1 Tax=Mugilogobius chulae TaxID=88201 RepID=A0AAW0MMJ7_9GOBI
MVSLSSWATTKSGKMHEAQNETDMVSCPSYHNNDTPVGSVRGAFALTGLKSSESESSMSFTHPGSHGDSDSEESEHAETKVQDYCHWTTNSHTASIPAEVNSKPKGLGDARGACVQQECPKCQAYRDHCKSAAENYRRVLNGYTDTVSELMAGFKTVLERYPELRYDSSDKRISYIVQAALGRNCLVREMVRMTAKRQFVRESTKIGERACNVDRDIECVQEALSTCYTDGEALRMVLQLYINLYLRYMEVWRDMCSRMTGGVTLYELVELTRERPGVTHGEPWSEAKAYVNRMRTKMRALVQGGEREALLEALGDVESTLLTVPHDFERRKTKFDRAMEAFRGLLDNVVGDCSTDAQTSNLYLDVRADLIVVNALVGVGEISIKTLLHERNVLVARVKTLTRNQGSLELKVAQKQRKLIDSINRWTIADSKMATGVGGWGGDCLAP